MTTSGQYRGNDIHAFQSEQRIAEIVRPEIDKVLATTDPEELLEMAGDSSLAPEARLTAEARYRAAYELVVDDHGHTRSAFKLEQAAARTAGLDSMRWVDPSHYGSLLDTPRAPGDPRPGPAPRPADQCERLCAAQDQARR
jgi:hypothetical protein